MTTTDGPGRGGSGPGRDDARAGSGRMTVEGATGDLAAARPRLVGARVTRREDPRLLRGEGSFLDDRHVHGMVHLAFRRSETAHGGLVGIDAAAARAMPGVIGVYTAADLAGIARPIRATSRMRDYHATPLRPLALDKVRHVGEPVAAVVAESRYAAEDAAERVALDIAPLPSLVDARSAAADRDTLIHEDAGTNVLAARAFGRGDIDRAMEEAAVRVAGRFRIHRKTPVALEPRGGLAEYDRRSRTLTLHSTTQIPGIVRDAFADIFAMPGSRVRVIASDVGGGFGAKATLYAEDICVAALALKLGRPVKWSGDRREDLLSTTQAFDETIEATLALDADGTVLALQADALGDVGACSVYPWTACLEPVQVVSFLPGPYRMPVYDARVRAVATSKPAGGPYRGVGRPIAAFVTERLMDMAAAELGMDPVALRRRNLVAEGEFPYKAASGLVWDRSSFVGCLDRACETAGYETLRGQRDATRAAGGWAGVGVACYAELTGLGSRISVAPGMPVNTGTEGASVEIDATGAVTAFFGVSSQGQGIETTLAQIVAGELGVGIGDVHVDLGDSATNAHSTGTYASRSAVLAGGAGILAARAVREKVVRCAAHLLEAAEPDIEIANGTVRVAGTDRTMGLAALAKAVYADMGRLPKPLRDEIGNLEARRVYDPFLATATSATHIAAVEIDRETCAVSIGRYVVVEDCGRVINPLIADGQVHGGVAQGVGAALLEEVVHDAAGQMLTASLADYLVPSSREVPRMEVVHLEDEPPGTLGGVRGLGEGGTIGGLAAVANAVADALAPLGVAVSEVPLTPARIFTLVEAARAAAES